MSRFGKEHSLFVRTTEGGSAARLNHGADGTQVFSAEPLQPGERFTFKVDKLITSGDNVPSVHVGLTCQKPDKWLKSLGLFHMSDTWLIYTLNGQKFRDGLNCRACRNWKQMFGARNLLKVDDVITVEQTEDRALGFSINDKVIPKAFTKLPKTDLWVVVHLGVREISIPSASKIVTRVDEEPLYINIDIPEIKDKITKAHCCFKSGLSDSADSHKEGDMKVTSVILGVQRPFCYVMERKDGRLCVNTEHLLRQVKYCFAIGRDLQESKGADLCHFIKRFSLKCPENTEFLSLGSILKNARYYIKCPDKRRKFQITLIRAVMTCCCCIQTRCTPTLADPDLLYPADPASPTDRTLKKDLKFDMIADLGIYIQPDHECKVNHKVKSDQPEIFRINLEDFPDPPQPPPRAAASTDTRPRPQLHGVSSPPRTASAIALSGSGTPTGRVSPSVESSTEDGFILVPMSDGPERPPDTSVPRGAMPAGNSGRLSTAVAIKKRFTFSSSSSSSATTPSSSSLSERSSSGGESTGTSASETTSAAPVSLASRPRSLTIRIGAPGTSTGTKAKPGTFTGTKAKLGTSSPGTSKGTKAKSVKTCKHGHPRDKCPHRSTSSKKKIKLSEAESGKDKEDLVKIKPLKRKRLMSADKPKKPRVPVPTSGPDISTRAGDPTDPGTPGLAPLAVPKASRASTVTAPDVTTAVTSAERMTACSKCPGLVHEVDKLLSMPIKRKKPTSADKPKKPRLGYRFSSLPASTTGGSSGEISDVAEDSRAKGNARSTGRTTKEKGTQTGYPWPDLSCEYYQSCRRYLQMLDISGVYLNETFDRCYCENCIRHRPPKNSPGTQRPVHWSRIGPQAQRFDIFNLWYIAYHGTLANNVGSILDCGDLLMPGDIAVGGRAVETPQNGSNTKKRVLLSPSIKYAGLPAFTSPERWDDPDTGVVYNARAAFLVRVKPDSYHVRGESVLPESLKEIEIDAGVPNSQLEWSTRQRGAVMPVALLVKLDKV